MTISFQLAEVLSDRLAEARRNREAAVLSEGQILTEISDLESALSAFPEIQTQLSELHVRLDQQRQELTALENNIAQAEEDDRAADRALVESIEFVRARCEKTRLDLPLLDSSAAKEWLSWLETWHSRSGRAFEPNKDWHRYFKGRKVYDSAIEELLQPVLSQIEALEQDEMVAGPAGRDLAEEANTRDRQIVELEASLREQVGLLGSDCGRVLADLPDPTGIEDEALLAAMERLLEHLARVLGRYAASARLESSTLEALA